MKRIELLTSDGSFVAIIEIPPFLPGSEPDIVQWGTRLFSKRDPDTYVEGFAVASLTEPPGLGREEVCHVGQCWANVVPGSDRCADHPPPPPVDRSQRTTLHGTPIDEVRKQHAAQPTGQHADYIVLSDAERAKGFVRPVRGSYKHLTCGAVTSMGRALSETYARDPKFYSATFCCRCNAHFPVGEDGEFDWYGTSEKVGT